MENIINFIRRIRNLGSHKVGIVKIIPPLSVKARVREYTGSKVLGMIIPTPQEQLIKKVVDDVYIEENHKKNPMSVSKYRDIANSKLYKTLCYKTDMDLEVKYWQSYPERTIVPIYGSGVSATLIDEANTVWYLYFNIFPISKNFFLPKHILNTAISTSLTKS